MEKIRSTVPATARVTWYAVAVALVAALNQWGALSHDATPSVTGVVIAVITLLFALVHSDTPWRQALYGLCAALAVFGTYLGWGSEEQFASVLDVVAPILGIATAAATTNANTNSVDAEQV